MILFVFAVIFLVIAALVVAGSFLAPVDTTTYNARTAEREATPSPLRRYIRAGAGIPALLGVICLVFSSIVVVGTHDIGVTTRFGKPVGALSNGLHFKAPWDSVTTLDGKVQTDSYASNGYNGSTQQGAQDGCVNVRIARQATACVNVFVRWQLTSTGDGVDYLFRNFKTTDNVRDNLLHRDLQSAINVAFADYDPLAIDTTTGGSTQPSNAVLATGVQTELTKEVGQYLDIQTVNIPLFSFDNDTQTRLNGLQQQVAQTRIAQQAVITAGAQASANAALAASVSNAPGVLESKCLDIVNEAIQKNTVGLLPAGFSCLGSGLSTTISASNPTPAPAPSK